MIGLYFSVFGRWAKMAYRPLRSPIAMLRWVRRRLPSPGTLMLVFPTSPCLGDPQGLKGQERPSSGPHIVLRRRASSVASPLVLPARRSASHAGVCCTGEAASLLHRRICEACRRHAAALDPSAEPAHACRHRIGRGIPGPRWRDRAPRSRRAWPAGDAAPQDRHTSEWQAFKLQRPSRRS